MSFKCLDDLRDALLKEFPQHKAPPSWSVALEQCPQDMEGDITVNCFRFAKVLGSSPDKIADAVARILSAHPDVAAASKVKAFVNATLKGAAVHRDSLAAPKAILASASLPEGTRRRILVEYSAPNTNKPQHLGHVRNNTLGMSLCSLLARVGHDVIPVNLINDRGIHICKSMLAYQRFGDGATPQSTGIKGDHFVGDFYVKYNDELKKQLSALKAAKPELDGKDDDELFLETEIGRAAQKMLQDWEAGVPEVVELWKTMNSWVIAGFQQTYERMGVKFEKVFLESQTYMLGRDLILKGLEEGVFQRNEKGAVVADLGKLGTKVLLRADGTSVYITQDIGTTCMKADQFGPDSQIWVVGDEQILHFQMLFAILAKMGRPWAKDLFHLAYGMVNLPTGKMKSREGTVVDADDLFDEMRRLAKEATLERLEGAEAPSDIEERSETIGMGALKFMLLKFNPKTTMMFDPQASLRFEGDTGPYVQYACARISSIMRKAAERGVSEAAIANASLASLDSKEERELSICAALYPQTLQAAAEKMDCSVLVGYLLDLAKSFNRFYRERKVLNAESEAERDARLRLCLAVREILADGLATLTIGIPEAM